MNSLLLLASLGLTLDSDSISGLSSYFQDEHLIDAQTRVLRASGRELYDMENQDHRINLRQAVVNIINELRAED